MKASDWNGRDIKAGEVLGNYARKKEAALCEMGSATGAHLHFTLRRDGKPVTLQGWRLSGYRVQVGKVNYDYDCENAYLLRSGTKYCPNTKILNDVKPKKNSDQGGGKTATK